MRSRLQHGYYIRVSRRSAQTTAGKGLAQGPYVAARAGVEPTTYRLRVIASTNAPPRPKYHHIAVVLTFAHNRRTIQFKQDLFQSISTEQSPEPFYWLPLGESAICPVLITLYPASAATIENRLAVGLGDVGVYYVPCNRRVAGSNLPEAT